MKVSLLLSFADTVTIIYSTMFQLIQACVKYLVDSGHRSYINISELKENDSFSFQLCCNLVNFQYISLKLRARSSV